MPRAQHIAIASLAATPPVAAQLSWQARPPPPLAGPPVIEHALFEDPTFLVIGAVAAAVIAAFVLARAGRPRAGALAALALAGIAAGVLALAAAVRTPREDVAQATRDLVAAVARVDEPAMDRALAGDVRLFANTSIPTVPIAASGLGKDQILAAVRAALGGLYPVREHDAAELTTALTGPNAARSQLRVRVVPEGWNMAHNSWWRLDWRRDADGAWRAFSITAWSLDGLGGP